MSGRKLIRDFLLSPHISHPHLQSLKIVNARSLIPLPNASLGPRHLSIFNEFSKKVKGEADSNREFQQSINQLKEKAEELKEVKEGFKSRTKETTKQLYKSVGGVWTEAEATAKKVSADVKEKISSTTGKVKETFGLGKQEPSESNQTSSSEFDLNGRHHTTSGAESFQNPESFDTKESINASKTFFDNFRSSFSSASPKVTLAFQKLKDAKIVDLAKKGFDIVKDELSSNPSKRRQMRYAAASSPKEPRSTKTDIVVVPIKQSSWRKKWDAFKDKMHDHPVFKRMSGIGDPVLSKGHEFAEDMRERWETSDHPVVHKIQDLNEAVFGETASALSFKEIRRRDPSFSLPEFVAEVQEMTRPTLEAYLKGNVEALKKNCSPEVIERCRAEHRAYESHGIFFDNKILHVSEVEVRETKMMGSSPIIVVEFRTQEVYCVRDKHGSITEGGKDTIHTVYYGWALQQVDEEESTGEVALHPVWRLREMRAQRLGYNALV